MAATKSPLRKQFEVERRRAAFLASLPAAMASIIAADTWVSPALGIPGGFAGLGAAYGLVYLYETLMWRKHHGS